MREESLGERGLFLTSTWMPVSFDLELPALVLLNAMTEFFLGALRKANVVAVTCPWVVDVRTSSLALRSGSWSGA